MTNLSEDYTASLLYPRVNDAGKVELVSLHDDRVGPIVRQLTQQQALHFMARLADCLARAKY